MRKEVLFPSLFKKLKSTTGETIVETLISVLISALALLLLSTAIGSSVNIVQSSRNHMEEYYSAESAGINKSTGKSGTIKSEVSLSNSASTITVDEYGDDTANLYLYRRQ